MIALVLSVVGVLLCPVMLLGFALGATALVQKKGSRGVAIAAMAFPLVAGPLVLAVVVPNFITFKGRSRQSECRSMLKSAVTEEKAFYEDKKQFSVHPAEIGFQPERGNRYVYLFVAEGPVLPNRAPPKGDAVGVGADTEKWPEASNARLLAAIPAAVRAHLGVSGQCPDCGVTIACAGNIDNDEAIDVWTISTRDRDGSPAGVAHAEVDDSKE